MYLGILATLTAGALLLLARARSRRGSRSVQDAIGHLAEGNLAVTVEAARGDEIGDVLARLKTMLEKLRSVASDVQAGARTTWRRAVAGALLERRRR